MKLNKLLVFVLLILLLAFSVSAITYSKAGDDFIDSNGQSCLVQSDTDCTYWVSWITLDYRDDSSLFKRLSNEGLSSQTISGDYKLFLEYKVYDGTVGKYQNRTDNVSVECNIECNDFNCSSRNVLSENFEESNSTEVKYEQIDLRNSDYLRCEFITHYVNNSVALSSNRVNYRLWQPSYESEQTEPDRRTILNLESNVEELNNRIEGTYKSTLDYIMGAMKTLIQLNFNLWVYMYWIALIGFVVGVFTLIFYIIFWVYKKIRGL